MMNYTNNTPNIEQLLTEAQASEILQIGVRTLQGWRVRGDGPQYRKLGRAVRYRLGDLREWADNQIVSSTSEGTVQ